MPKSINELTSIHGDDQNQKYNIVERNEAEYEDFKNEVYKEILKGLVIGDECLKSKL